MQIQTNISLKDYSTMRIGGLAKALITVHSKQDLQQAVEWARTKKLPILPLGGGSNVIFSNGYNGLVIINRIKGYTVVSDTPASTVVQVGAGEEWDDVVRQSVQNNLHGIEMLSAIPGTAGATPVQNVGAYGTSIAKSLIELEAYDLNNNTFVTLSKDDCKLGYRDSMFKQPQNKHYVITSITLQLHKTLPAPPFYASLQTYLDEHGITAYTPQTIRDAVIAIRAQKLPDPRYVANTGSFFKNPILPGTEAQVVLAQFPQVQHWQLKNDRIKFAAGWLIEHTGLRGYKAHGMKLYDQHALVVINENAQGYGDLLAFKDEIVAKVKQKFGITLEQEPELL